MILVSSCLLGNPVRFDGQSKPCNLLVKYKDCGCFLPICPETAGKLTIPRPPAEIQQGNGHDVWHNEACVQNKEGLDVTKSFKNGALAYEKLLRQGHISALILKERSPSCGVHFIYDGSFTGTTITGQGVAAAFFSQFNIPVYSEEDLDEDLLQKLISQDKKQ